jgi:ornithine carbamoyltransferase
MNVTIGCPFEYEPDPEILREARAAARATGSKLMVVYDPADAVLGADAVYADVWASMGEEAEHEKRAKALAPFQVTSAFMALAKPDAVFLHCLPAKRGEEVASEVIDGPHTVVWQESANRLPTEQALLSMLISYQREQANDA